VSEDFQAIVEKMAFVVDAEGRKKAVILDYPSWQELLNLLEDIEDSAEIEASRLSGNEPIPWEEAKVKLRVKGINI
jgi:hypothetical protein